MHIFFILINKMKSTSFAQSSHLFLLLLLCMLLVMQQVAECRTMDGGLESKPAFKSRKILEGLRRDAHRFKVVARKKQEGFEDWELRNVPAGPDPLHHHGGTTPNKP